MADCNATEGSPLSENEQLGIQKNLNDSNSSDNLIRPQTKEDAKKDAIPEIIKGVRETCDDKGIKIAYTIDCAGPSNDPLKSCRIRESPGLSATVNAQLPSTISGKQEAWKCNHAPEFVDGANNTNPDNLATYNAEMKSITLTPSDALTITSIESSFDNTIACWGNKEKSWLSLTEARLASFTKATEQPSNVKITDFVNNLPSLSMVSAVPNDDILRVEFDPSFRTLLKNDLVNHKGKNEIENKSNPYSKSCCADDKNITSKVDTAVRNKLCSEDASIEYDLKQPAGSIWQTLDDAWDKLCNKKGKSLCNKGVDEPACSNAPDSTFTPPRLMEMFWTLDNLFDRNDSKNKISSIAASVNCASSTDTSTLKDYFKNVNDFLDSLNAVRMSALKKQLHSLNNERIVVFKKRIAAVEDHRMRGVNQRILKRNKKYHTPDSSEEEECIIDDNDDDESILSTKTKENFSNDKSHTFAQDLRSHLDLKKNNEPSLSGIEENAIEKITIDCKKPETLRDHQRDHLSDCDATPELQHFQLDTLFHTPQHDLATALDHAYPHIVIPVKEDSGEKLEPVTEDVCQARHGEPRNVDTLEIPLPWSNGFSDSSELLFEEVKCYSCKEDSCFSFYRKNDTLKFSMNARSLKHLCKDQLCKQIVRYKLRPPVYGMSSETFASFISNVATDFEDSCHDDLDFLMMLIEPILDIIDSGNPETESNEKDKIS